MDAGNAYGKHLSCPPYSPTPDETEKILSDYKDAVLIEFVGLPKETTVDPVHIHHHLWDLNPVDSGCDVQP